MPTYGKENFKESNVNYLNKDYSEVLEKSIEKSKNKLGR